MLELKNRLKQVRKEITKLKKEEATIEKKLRTGAKTFKERLKLWFEAENTIHEPWLIKEKTYPHLRNYFEDWLQRYQEYDIRETFHDSIDDYLKGIEIPENIRLCLEEAVEKNLGSFTCDW